MYNILQRYTIKEGNEEKERAGVKIPQVLCVAIPVNAGQPVAQGDLLGKILDLSHGDLSGGEPGTHFDLRKDGTLVCPGDYFSPTAMEETLPLLWAMYPEAKICYP